MKYVEDELWSVLAALVIYLVAAWPKASDSVDARHISEYLSLCQILNGKVG